MKGDRSEMRRRRERKGVKGRRKRHVGVKELRPLHTNLRPKNAYRRRPDFYVRYIARLLTHRKDFS